MLHQVFDSFGKPLTTRIRVIAETDCYPLTPACVDGASLLQSMVRQEETGTPQTG